MLLLLVKPYPAVEKTCTCKNKCAGLDFTIERLDNNYLVSMI